MHPLRILILGILLYLLFRLIFGRKRRAFRPERRGGGPGGLPSHDVLVEDPICHTYVPKGQAVVYKDGESLYYFCSEKCRQTFVEKKGDNR